MSHKVDYTDYLYDEKEDYYTNIDYTHPDNLEGYENAVRVESDAEVANKALEDLISLNDFSFGSHFVQAIVVTAFVSVIVLASGKLPGHANGSFWPVFIPEHYGRRNSQHPFDPYSFVHFDHGILSYYMFGHLDSRRLPGLRRLETHFKSGVGLFVTLLTAMMFEFLENSKAIISLFRKNSGTSGVYRGDSTINVVGDLISCALGYNVARYLAVQGYPWLPVLIYIILEFSLATTIRDNLFLIITQLLRPINWIRKWQADIIPYRSHQSLSLNDYEAGYWGNKFVPRRFRKYQPNKKPIM